MTNCDYCMTDRDGYVKPLDKNAHTYVYGEILRVNYFKNHLSVNINYCPMCGRQLRKENNNDNRRN